MGIFGRIKLIARSYINSRSDSDDRDDGDEDDAPSTDWKIREKFGHLKDRFCGRASNIKLEISAAIWEKSHKGDPPIAECFKILGLPFGSSLAEIEARWKKLMIETHPDRVGENQSAAKINQAHQVLKKFLEQANVN